MFNFLFGGRRQTDRQPVKIAPRGVSDGLVTNKPQKAQPKTQLSERDKRIRQKKARKANRRKSNGVSRYQGGSVNGRKKYTPIFKREIYR